MFAAAVEHGTGNISEMKTVVRTSRWRFIIGFPSWIPGFDSGDWVMRDLYWTKRYWDLLASILHRILIPSADLRSLNPNVILGSGVDTDSDVK
jgi:hypothetical protein